MIKSWWVVPDCNRLILLPPFFYSAQITIVAGYLNSSFPFHTEPDYEISGGFVDGMGQFNSIVGILDYVILQYLTYFVLRRRRAYDSWVCTSCQTRAA